MGESETRPPSPFAFEAKLTMFFLVTGIFITKYKGLTLKNVAESGSLAEEVSFESICRRVAFRDLRLPSFVRSQVISSIRTAQGGFFLSRQKPKPLDANFSASHSLLDAEDPLEDLRRPGRRCSRRWS